MNKRNREKTAFIRADGLYRFKSLPSDLCSAPATSQSIKNTVLSGLKWQTCILYLDYVIVLSSTFSEHLKDCLVFLTPSEQLVSSSRRKCHFGHHELCFFGPRCQLRWRPTRSQEGIRNLLDVYGGKGHSAMRVLFCRRFIPNISDIGALLTGLTCNDVAFLWTNEQQAALENLRCVEAPPLTTL